MPRRPDGSSAIECVAGGLEEETNVAARLDRGRVDTATGTVTVTVTQHSYQAVGSRRMRIVSRLTILSAYAYIAMIYGVSLHAL